MLTPAVFLFCSQVVPCPCVSAPLDPVARRIIRKMHVFQQIDAIVLSPIQILQDA